MPARNVFEIAKIAQTQAVKKRKSWLKRKAQQNTNKTHMNLTRGSAKQRQGSSAEQQARDYLSSHGLKILAQNLRCRLGEIDIIAVDDDTLVFIEVRQRHCDSYGGAAASINIAKQKHIIRSAYYFLPRLQYLTGKSYPCRFDVIAIEGTQLNWIKSAFTI